LLLSVHARKIKSESAQHTVRIITFESDFCIKSISAGGQGYLITLETTGRTMLHGNLVQNTRSLLKKSQNELLQSLSPKSGHESVDDIHREGHRIRGIGREMQDATVISAY